MNWGWLQRMGHDGVAAVEMAICAPILISLFIASYDFGAALLSKARVQQALASAAEYATLAGLNGVSSASIAANAQTIAGALSSPFLGQPTVSAIVNAGAGSGSKCCLGTPWTCSTTTTSCSDGSTPGVYMKITASYPFKPVFTLDAALTGVVITGTVTLVLS